MGTSTPRSQNYRPGTSRGGFPATTFRQQMSDFARGQEIKRLRDARGLSRERLAHEIDVSTKTVYSWERHNGGIRPGNLQTLSEFFEVDPDSLVVREEQIANLIRDGGPPTNGKVSEQLEDVLERLTALDRRVGGLAQQLAEMAEAQRELAKTHQRFDTRLRKLAQTVEASPTSQRRRAVG